MKLTISAKLLDVVTLTAGCGCDCGGVAAVNARLGDNDG
jgi:hypothetical protein